MARVTPPCGIVAEAFAKQREASWHDYATYKGIDSKEWPKRGLKRRVMEHFCYRWNEML